MRKFGLLAVVVVLLVLLSRATTAQFDPGLKIYLYQNGVLVGEVFAPDRPAGATVYTEHWVLYKTYRYPGPLFVGELLVAPMPSLPNPVARLGAMAQNASPATERGAREEAVIRERRGAAPPRA